MMIARRTSRKPEPVAPPSPEVRAILKEFCAKKRAELGPDWKRILAEEMTQNTMPLINALFAVKRRRR